jgi:serine/threonine protein kinase
VLTLTFTIISSFVIHSSVIYRDIKQENVGFDIRGDVKVFDFGLSKGLSSELKARDEKTGEIKYGYNLTPRTGSVPYMAPEIMIGAPYDGQCDVYSLSILLWEIFTLRHAFKYMDRYEYIERVVKNGERPLFPIGTVPIPMKELIKDSWVFRPTQRPTMSNVSKRIREELNAMCDGDDKVLRRSIHMINRSNHSFRIHVQRQRSTHSLLWQGSPNFRETDHDLSTSPSKVVAMESKDVLYNQPSLRNGIEC